MHHSFDKLTLNVNIPLSLAQTRRQALSITSDIRTQMEDSLSDMAGGNWCRLEEMRHKYCQFQDLCLYNPAGLNWLLKHDSWKPITNKQTSSIHHVVLCVRRPSWGMGEMPQLQVQICIFIFCLSLESSIWGQKKCWLPGKCLFWMCALLLEPRCK